MIEAYLPSTHEFACTSCGTGQNPNRGFCINCNNSMEGAPTVEKKVVKPPRELVRKRWLRWRGQRWQEGMCSYCQKLKPLVPQTDCGKRNLPPPLPPSMTTYGQVTWKASFTVLKYGGTCSQCTFKVIEDIERAASALRAAQAGGEWEEEKLSHE